MIQPPNETPLYVSGLFAKPAHGLPMRPVSSLGLSPSEGIKGDASPEGRSPRHITLVHRDSLEQHGIDAGAARVNVVLEGSAPSGLASGAALHIGNTRIRITFSCEPCAHGAEMADAPMRRFRMLDRYCGLVVDGGTVDLSDATARVISHAYEVVPDTFAERCSWASSRIPRGQVVTGLDFLRAIGASRSYARVLPRWLTQAGRSGAPIHRILAANFSAPSWCPPYEQILASEGLNPLEYRNAKFDLSDHLWSS